jgi:hypothetical protein
MAYIFSCYFTEIYSKVINMTIAKNTILRDRLLAKGEIVAGFLNVAHGEAKQKRVLDLMERYRKLQHLLPGIVAGRPFRRVQGGPYNGELVYDLRESREAARLVKQINRLLAHYRFRRAVPVTLQFAADESPRIETETYPTHSVPFSRGELRNLQMGRGSGTMEEHGAVENVIELAAAGELDRLRECAFCSKWFMASRTDRIYHEGCGVKQHRKERAKSGIHNEYQKWYRKYAPLNFRKEELEEKRNDGFHLSKPERDELQQVMKDAKRLKDEWQVTLRKLKGETSEPR